VAFAIIIGELTRATAAEQPVAVDGSLRGPALNRRVGWQPRRVAMIRQTTKSSPQLYARICGILYLYIFVADG